MPLLVQYLVSLQMADDGESHPEHALQGETHLQSESGGDGRMRTDGASVRHESEGRGSGSRHHGLDTDTHSHSSSISSLEAGSELITLGDHIDAIINNDYNNKHSSSNLTSAATSIVSQSEHLISRIQEASASG